MTAVEVTAESVPAEAPDATGRRNPAQLATETERLDLRLARRASDLVLLARPRQWAKTLLAVPLALLDTPAWTVGALARTGWAVLLFTLASSLVYVVNDIADRDLDRRHPVKRVRPVASGRISVATAVGFAGVLAGLLGLAFTVGPALPGWPLAAYLVLNVAYSRWLKHIPLVDISVVATGFGLRVVLGYAATGAAVSVWLLTAVFTACLVLILGKRRGELATQGTGYRPALRGYTLNLADHLISVNATLTVAAFLMYLHTDAPIGAHREAIVLAALPLTLLAISRYLQAVLVHHGGADPVRTLLRDRLIVGSAALLAAAVGAGLLAASLPTS